MGQIWLVRHGQASFGAADYDVLSDTGTTQATATGRWLARQGVRPDRIERGTMRRHRDTLDAMLAATGWDATVTEDAGWDELDHLAVVAASPEAPDDLLTLDRRAFQTLYEQATGRWMSGEHDQEYAETFAGFVARVGTALRRTVAEAGPGRSVLVVSSGGVIAAAAALLVDPLADPAGRGRLWATLNAVLVNAGYSRVIVGSTGARLLSYNEHPHLAGPLLTYR